MKSEQRCRWPDCDCKPGCDLYWVKLADWDINGCKVHGDRCCKVCPKPPPSLHPLYKRPAHFALRCDECGEPVHPQWPQAHQCTQSMKTESPR